MTRPPRELREFLYQYDPALQSLALGVRTVVHEEMTPCHEYIFAMRSKVVLLYGATERVVDDGICHINVFARHVNLGFQRGAELDDPGGVLQGTGKTMRHITLRKLSDLERPEIRAYLRQARKHAGLKRRHHRTADEVMTRVKRKSLARLRQRPRTALPPGFIG
jgi:DNA helicase IV